MRSDCSERSSPSSLLLRPMKLSTCSLNSTGMLRWATRVPLLGRLAPGAWAASPAGLCSSPDSAFENQESDSSTFLPNIFHLRSDVPEDERHSTPWLGAPGARRGAVNAPNGLQKACPHRDAKG